MKIKFNSFLLIAVSVSVFTISSCKKDRNTLPEAPFSATNGVYILNEGGLNIDNVSLSFFSLEDKTMKNNVFVSANPTMKLGNGGNDLGIYGSKLYVVVNGSNKVEIADASSSKSLKTIDITEPSHVAFHGKHAFVSSYTDRVFVIDTASLTIVKEIEVGRTPEQLAVSGDRIFVANAGWKDGYLSGEYDNTVSVIDANSLVKIDDIVVDKNVDQVYTDNKGKVYVINAPIFGAWPEILHPSRLYVINATSLEIEKSFDFAGIAMAIKDNTAYLISDNYEACKTLFLEMNLSNYAVTVKGDQLADIQSPYGLAVDPKSGDIWIGDALSYSDNGKLFRFINNVKEPESYPVGVSPRKFVFKK
jgi:YVTN family beta-propeller protein